MLPGPHVKKLIITSSIDNEKASIAPDVTPGINSGNVTFKNVFTLFAPKSIAASSKDLSKPAILALTFITTNGIEKVICAKVILPNPKGIFNIENIDNN